MANLFNVGKHKTRIYDEAGYKKVKYWDTDVVSFKQGHVKLNTGGYKTLTTKTRMNQASRQFGLGYNVFQHKGNWFVEHKGKKKQFMGNEIDLFD